MRSEVWLIISPLLGVMFIGAIMLLVGVFLMIGYDIRTGIQPVACGLIAILIPGSVVAAIFYLEREQ